MVPLVQKHMSELAALCRKHGVRKLDLFGSGATGRFDEKTSDIDFVIEFTDYGPGIANRFLGFADDAEALFGRPVDLVFESKMKNPFFRAAVNATREPLYDAARDREAIA